MPTQTTNTYPKREPLEALRADLTVRIPLTVKAGSKVRRGAVLGVVTATDYIRERSRSLASAAFAAAVTVIAVEDASVFMATDVLKLEDGTTIGTVAASGVNIVDNELTLTAGSAVALADGDAVLASDGSQAAKAIADEAVAASEAKDTTLSPYIGGALKKNLIIGLDASAMAELGGAAFPGNVFKF